MPEPELPPTPEFEVPRGGVFVTGGPDGIGEVPWEEVAPATPLEIAAAEGGAGGDPAIEFRRTLGRFATGVTVITIAVGDQVHGMTANAFMSVSLKPPLVAISVDRRARMHSLMHEGRRFGVSVLSSEQSALSDHFAGRARDGTPEYRFGSVHDTPLVDGALANVVARVVRSYWGGDHSLFLGQVEYARYGEGRPLLFHAGQYEGLPLASVSVFSGLPPDLQQAILARGEVKTFAGGESVLGEGESGDVLFLLLEGTVSVERAGRPIATLHEGDFFGEVSVLAGGPRTAAVIAETAVRCLTVSRETLRETLAADPEVAWAMLESVAGRLREP